MPYLFLFLKIRILQLPFLSSVLHLLQVWEDLSSVALPEVCPFFLNGGCVSYVVQIVKPPVTNLIWGCIMSGSTGTKGLRVQVQLRPVSTEWNGSRRGAYQKSSHLSVFWVIL